MQCPAPILKLSEAAKRHRASATTLTVLATDADFLTDLQAWCRTTKSSLVRLEHEQDGVIRALVRLAPPVSTAPSSLRSAETVRLKVGGPVTEPELAPTERPPSHREVEAQGPAAPARLDLIGLPAVAALRKVNEAAASGPGRVVEITSDAPGFEARLTAWIEATEAELEAIENDGPRVLARVRFARDGATDAQVQAARAANDRRPSDRAPGDRGPSYRGPSDRVRAPSERATSVEAPAGVRAGPKLREAVTVKDLPRPLRSPLPILKDSYPPLSYPPLSEPPLIHPMSAAPRAAVAISEMPQANMVMAGVAAPRENRATLLVLHNDLEALLAALMVANASAAQGMQTEVYFAFWGIHLLRGEKPRAKAAPAKVGWLQRMLLWMVPKGPSRQKLGKLHMGGLGTRILLRIMRKRNILALEQLVEAAASQGVTFKVCSMSMGLMGLAERDIVELPNVEFAGVTSFAEAAGRSAVSLVF